MGGRSLWLQISDRGMGSPALLEKQYEDPCRHAVWLKAIDFTTRLASGPEVQQIELGGAFVGKFNQLPTTYAAVVFECTSSNSSADPTKLIIRPKLPLLLTKVPLTIQKGKCMLIK